MVKDGVAFAPDPGTGELTFTVKENLDDADSAAIYQKNTLAGITFSGSTARVSQIREDTLDLLADLPVGHKRDFFIELLWRDSVTMLSEPVAAGGLRITRRLTQAGEATLPIHTAEAPVYSTVVFNRYLGHYELLYLGEVDGDGDPILRSEFFSTAPPANSPLVMNRYTGLQELLFIDETDGDGYPILKTEPV
jgi:hypothetical protein